jgi:hypothetical protein
MPVHTLIRPVSGRAAGVKKPFHVHPPFEGERNFLLRPPIGFRCRGWFVTGSYVTTARALGYERNCHHLVIGPTIAPLVHFAIRAVAGTATLWDN